MRLGVVTYLVVLASVAYGTPPSTALIDALFPPSAEAPCVEVLRVLSPYRAPTANIPLHAQGKALYITDDLLTGAERLENVQITVAAGDDLERMAEVLSEVAEVDRLLVLETLRRHARSKMPLDLKSFFRDPARLRTGQFSKCDGPNCFNAVLLWHGIGHSEQRTSAQEFVEALGEFRPVQKGDALRLGDVIVIDHPATGEPIHAAIFLDEHLIWHKAGKSKLTPWTFETLEAMVAYYQRFVPGFRVRFLRKLSQPETFGSAPEQPKR